jgi:hypothetical protein
MFTKKVTRVLAVLCILVLATITWLFIIFMAAPLGPSFQRLVAAIAGGLIALVCAITIYNIMRI